MKNVKFNENATIKEILNEINKMLNEENKKDCLTPDMVTEKIKDMVPYDKSKVKLLSGKRIVEIYNKIFGLTLKKNEINKKDEYDTLLKTVTEINNFYCYDENITYSEMKKEYQSNKEKEEKRKREAFDRDINRVKSLLNKFDITYEDFKELNYRFNELQTEHKLWGFTYRY